ncbi:DUF6177 family protein [Streptomyces sp. bgisy034]|uniref:DUF6177 family protein n=1 Tax=Streptomyces sp. bgisy034 TaxID=3413774 RepID=UPI003EC0B963
MAVGHPYRPPSPLCACSPHRQESKRTSPSATAATKPPPVDAIQDLATELDAQHGLVNLFTALRASRRDLIVPAHLDHPRSPSHSRSATPGPSTSARSAPEHPSQSTPVRLGLTAQAALHYPQGDGTGLEARTTFQHLTRRLTPA